MGTLAGDDGAVEDADRGNRHDGSSAPWSVPSYGLRSWTGVAFDTPNAAKAP